MTIKKPHIDPFVGRYKAEEFLRVLDNWVPKEARGNFLKTDLREEAYGEDQVLFSLLSGKISFFGIDINPLTVAKSRQNSLARARKDCFIASDARQTPFKDGFFDIIFSPSTLDHFRDDADLNKSLAELKRIAKPDAIFIIAMNNAKNLPFRFSAFIGKWLGLIKEPTRFYTLDELFEFCKAAGLVVEEVDSAVVMMSPLNRFLLWLRKFLKPQVIDDLSKKLVHFFKTIGRSRKIRTSLGWFVVLKCRHSSYAPLARLVLIAGIISLFFFFGRVSPGFCAAGSTEKEESLPPLDDKNLSQFNTQLTDENLLDYFKTREELLKYSYDELAGLQEKLRGSNTFRPLQDNLTKVLHKKEIEDILCLPEDIEINNRPDLLKSPFYPRNGQKYNIAALIPQAEYLYFDNIYLPYQKLPLHKFNESLWMDSSLDKISAEGAKLSAGRAVGESARAGDLSGFARDLHPGWSYAWESDHVSDYPFDMRQWKKRYPENDLKPEVYQGTMLLRNTYNLFCIDFNTGREIWSLGIGGRKGQAFYQTFFHPDNRPYGYGITLSDGVVYSQLSESLAAIDVQDILFPKTRWVQPLGEYALCTRPVVAEQVVVTGLINTRMEVWVCGFGVGSGDLLWSDYIGTSSFLAPSCSLSLFFDGKVFLGTNTGVFIAVEPKNGKVDWIKKYIPKKYSLINYWHKGLMSGFFDKSNVPYDTETLEMGSDGLLYYKPRESDYLYVLDPSSGKEEKRILIDSQQYYLLRARDGEAVFLDKKSRNGLNEINVIRLDNGFSLYSKKIQSGPLQGVEYIDNHSFIFKVGENVHALTSYSQRYSDFVNERPIKGWLLPSRMPVLLSGDGRLVSCHIFSNYSLQGILKNNRVETEMALRKSFFDKFQKAMLLQPESDHAVLVKKELSSLAINVGPFLQHLVLLIDKNVSMLGSSSWRDFIEDLARLYGEQFITYKDITIKFKNYLFGAGLLQPPLAGRELPFFLAKGKTGPAKELKVSGEQLFFLPIKVIAGPTPPPFFLILNFDQLLCVDESGKILWDRPIYYRPNIPQIDGQILNDSDRNRGRLLADDVEAYLFDDILVINDHVNIVAINALSGSYLWSATNKDEILSREKELSLSDREELYRKYGVQPSFIINAMFQTLFLEDKIFLIHNNKISSLDPRTGFCQKDKKLKLKGVIQVATFGNYIALLSLRLDKVIVLDKELLDCKEFALDFVQEKTGYPELFFMGDSLLLSLNGEVYVIDRNDGHLRERKKLLDPQKTKTFLEIFENTLFVIEPFERARAYSLVNNSLSKNWEVSLSDSGSAVIWKEPERKSHYYYLFDHSLWCPIFKSGKFFMSRIDVETGIRQWVSGLRGVHSYFYNLSNAILRDGTLYFILSLTSDINSLGLNSPSRLASTIMINIESKLIGLDVETGASRRIESLSVIPSGLFKLFGFQKAILGETSDCFIYNIHGNILTVRKDK